jgi:hypothetical protein
MLTALGVIFQAHELNGTVTIEVETTVCYGQLHDFQYLIQPGSDALCTMNKYQEEESESLGIVIYWKRDRNHWNERSIQYHVSRCIQAGWTCSVDHRW